MNPITEICLILLHFQIDENNKAAMLGSQGNCVAVPKSTAKTARQSEFNPTQTRQPSAKLAQKPKGKRYARRRC